MIMKGLLERMGRCSFLFLALIILLVTVFLPLIGVLLRLRFSLPFLISLPPYFLMISLLYRGRRREAVYLMLFWAFLLGAVMSLLVYFLPEKTAVSIINGPPYRDEMFYWVKTGIGKEGTPSLFIPEHLIHLGVFLLLSLVSASFLAIALGAVLVDYMAFYVGSLLLHSRSFALTFLLGWHFWSLIRIVAYVILGVVLAEPLLSRILKYPFRLRDVKWYLLIAGICLIADILLKALFAPSLRSVLLRLVILP